MLKIMKTDFDEDIKYVWPLNISRVDLKKYRTHSLLRQMCNQRLVNWLEPCIGIGQKWMKFKLSNYLSRHDGGLQLEEHCFCRYHPQLRNGYLSSFNVILYPYKIITCYLVTLSYLVILLSGKTVTLIPYYLSYSVTLLHCYFVTLLP